MHEPVTIVDRDVLKVLSAETRMDILKVLTEGSRTPAYLSKKLRKSDATIVEHLEMMCRADLVKKIEQPGRKWIFYTLTEKGESIVSGKRSRLLIVLSITLLSAGAGIANIGTYLWVQSSRVANSFGQKAAESLTQSGSQSASQAGQATISLWWMPYASFILLAISAFGTFYYIRAKRRL